MKRPVAVLLSALVIFSACIVEAPTSEGTKATAPKLPPAPPAEMRSGAQFGEALELSSVIINPSRGVTGEAVRVGARFHVIKPVPADYMVFVHVEDADGRSDRINVDHAPMRGQRTTSSLKAGEDFVDEFDIPIPPNMPVRGLTLILGFWDPKTDARLPITNPDKVRTDGNNRLIVGAFPVVQPN